MSGFGDKWFGNQESLPGANEEDAAKHALADTLVTQD